MGRRSFSVGTPSQHLAGRALAPVDNGTDKVDCGGQYKHGEPPTVRLSHELRRQWPAKDPGNGCLCGTISTLEDNSFRFCAFAKPKLCSNKQEPSERDKNMIQ